jgi:predicted AlkP superfamily pyrophosphatase or phosphodiesterase
LAVSHSSDEAQAAMTVNRTRVGVAVTTVTVLLVGACARDRGGPAVGPAVVLLSIDGFRSEYLDRFEAPHLRALAARGVRARWMQPSFPVLTFPNHYTIVTGLTPPHHGIIGNTIDDPADSAWFRITDTVQVRRSFWWGGEPLWVTAEQQGVRAASYFWPGSEAAIRGVRPTFWKHYQDDVPLAARVDTVLDWLTRPDSLRPRFVTLYFSSVDHAGHDDGPGSDAVRAAILGVDSAVGRLVGGLAAAGLSERVNLVVVADHGMAETGPPRMVFIDDYVDSASVDVLNLGAVVALAPRRGDTTGLLRALRRAPHLQVYRGDSTPERWRYRGNPRISAVVGVPDPGWLFTSRSWARRPRNARAGGSHGYEPADTSMHALFIASGPAFQAGMTAEPFGNIHVYELLCSVLGLRPATNDGSLDSVRTFLRQ